MAKSRVITRTVVARAPTPTIRISAPAPISRRGRVRRGARRVGRAIASEKDMLIPIAAAAALGYAEKQKMAIPAILGFTAPTSAGLIAYAIGKWGRSRLAMNCAVGFLCVSANRFFSGTSGVTGEGGTAAVFDD